MTAQQKVIEVEFGGKETLLILKCGHKTPWINKRRIPNTKVCKKCEKLMIKKKGEIK